MSHRIYEQVAGVQSLVYHVRRYREFTFMGCLSAGAFRHMIVRRFLFYTLLIMIISYNWA